MIVFLAFSLNIRCSLSQSPHFFNVVATFCLINGKADGNFSNGMELRRKKGKGKGKEGRRRDGGGDGNGGERGLRQVQGKGEDVTNNCLKCDRDISLKKKHQKIVSAFQYSN